MYEMEMAVNFRKTIKSDHLHWGYSRLPISRVLSELDHLVGISIKQRKVGCLHFHRQETTTMKSWLPCWVPRYSLNSVRSHILVLWAFLLEPPCKAPAFLTPLIFCSVMVQLVVAFAAVTSFAFGFLRQGIIYGRTTLNWYCSGWHSSSDSPSSASQVLGL